MFKKEKEEFKRDISEIIQTTLVERFQYLGRDLKNALRSGTIDPFSEDTVCIRSGNGDNRVISTLKDQIKEAPAKMFYCSKKEDFVAKDPAPATDADIISNVEKKTRLARNYRTEIDVLNRIKQEIDKKSKVSYKFFLNGSPIGDNIKLDLEDPLTVSLVGALLARQIEINTCNLREIVTGLKED